MAARISRREWAQQLAALTVTAPLFAGAGGGPYVIGNDAIRFSIQLANGKVISRAFRSRLTGEEFELPGDDLALEFEAGGPLAFSSGKAEVSRHSESSLEIVYRREEVTVQVQYDLPRGKKYLRKQVRVRCSGRPRRLLRADLENWMGVRRNWKSMTADRLQHGSHPIYCDTVFAGVEFVAAFNEYGREGFILRSRPGGIRVGSDWVSLNSTVTGVSRPGAIREAFLEYMEDVRLAPARLVACYNSWWTLPEVVTRKDNLALIQTLRERFYDRHGVFFDIVTTDMGWSNPRSIWEIDRTQLPDGLQGIRGMVEGAGGRLGLWMSPSEVYPPVCDYEWLEKNGYVVLRHEEQGKQVPFALSLADPKYRNAVKEQLPKLIRDSGLGHIKYDGFAADEPKAHHDLLAGDDSIEPLARYSLELIEVSKAANKDLVTEPTYMNSLANYISPWILKYSDSVWGNSGGDCPPGLRPAPDYRESHTTAREYFIFTSLDEVWLPQNALQYFDIVHCDEAAGFPNHAAMAFGRGRFFVSTYINPKFMADSDWEIYAGLLKWARRNQEVLRHTVMLTARVELGEPYAYAHWNGTRGIIALRNPSNESKKFTLDLAKAGAPQGLSDAVCYAQYPYRKGILEGLSGASAVTLDLAPWELTFLEIVPRAELAEPVALGARWYRDSTGGMKVASEGSGNIRILLPHSGEQTAATKPIVTGDPRGEVLTQKIDRLPEANWLRQGEKPLPTASFELDSEISIPEGAVKGKALLLLEFPGNEHLPSTCSCQVNGRAATLRESSSAGHIGYNMVTPECPWKSLFPYLSHWTWYICELESGSARVKFSGECPHERCRVGLWAWAEWDLAQQSVPVAMECPEPAMPQHQGYLKRRGTCVLSPGGPRE